MQWVVEDCLCLDTNILAKGCWFDSDVRIGVISWKSGAKIRLTYYASTFSLELDYSVGEKPNIQTISVSKAQCHFGGYRYYFHCPGCGSRRYKLHCAHSGFYCRSCYRLPYYSQECGPIDGLIRQRSKLEAKLDRPMRTKTRARTIEKLYAADDKVNTEAVKRFGIVVARQYGFC